MPAKEIRCYAQQEIKYERLARRKIINKVGIILGPTYLMPYQNPDFVYGFNNPPNPSPNLIPIYRMKNKFGITAGVTALHSINDKIEIEGRALYEKMGYIEEQQLIQPGNDELSKLDVDDHYLTTSALINYTAKRNLIFSLGFRYNRILNSNGVSTTYVNGVGSNISIINFTNDYLNQFNGNILASTGYIIEVTKKTQLRIQLQFGFGVGNQVKATSKYFIKSNEFSFLTTYTIKH